MLIDWFTVGAQIINFLILAGLLKYFLYGRITGAMREREESIAARLAEARAREEEAELERQRYRQQNQELDSQRDLMLARAREEAEQKRRRLLDQARGEVERAKSRWQEAIQREKAAFLADLQQRAGRQISLIARRALADLAGADLEERIAWVFCQQLHNLDEAKRRLLQTALQARPDAVITSAFPLPEPARQEIAGILNSYVGSGIKVDYHLSPKVIAGIELRVPGHKVAWSLDDYLEALEAELQAALAQED